MYGHDNNEMFPYYSTNFPSQFQFLDHINVPLSLPTNSQPLDPFPGLRSEFSHSSNSLSSSLTSPTNQGINQLYGSSPTSIPTTPVSRNVFSSSDLQDMNDVVQHDLSMTGGMIKACKYSPEEKKDKIERYKTKRNQRNFNKKIKYECRKTLANNRQRIRGRFARNDESEKINYHNDQWDQALVVEEEDEKWISSFLMQQQQYHQM